MDKLLPYVTFCLTWLFKDMIHQNLNNCKLLQGFHQNSSDSSEHNGFSADTFYLPGKMEPLHYPYILGNPISDYLLMSNGKTDCAKELFGGWGD